MSFQQRTPGQGMVEPAAGLTEFMLETDDEAADTTDAENFDPVRDTEELVRSTRDFLDKCDNPEAFPKLVSIVEEM